MSVLPTLIISDSTDNQFNRSKISGWGVLDNRPTWNLCWLDTIWSAVYLLQLASGSLRSAELYYLPYPCPDQDSEQAGCEEWTNATLAPFHIPDLRIKKLCREGLHLVQKIGQIRGWPPFGPATQPQPQPPDGWPQMEILTPTRNMGI